MVNPPSCRYVEAQQTRVRSPPHAIRWIASPSDRFFKARQNRLDEGVLHQIDDGLPRAGSGMLQRARKIRLRGDFLPWSVLKEMRHAPHQTFVELVKQAFFFVLPRIVYLHVLEERFDVALHSAVLDAQFGIQREQAGRHVKIPIGPEQLVHRAHLRPLDLDVQIKVGRFRLGAKRPAHDRGASTHELAQ